MQRILSLCLFAGALFLAACSKDPEKTAPPAASASTQAATPSAAAASAAPSADPGALPPPNMASIPERFDQESKNRPPGTPRAEDIFAAFTKAGATLRETRQHLGSPFKAEYCIGTKTGKDISMSVCEYKDEETATKGREMSDKAFGTPRRAITQNHATTLTLRRGDDDASDKALAKTLVDAFMKVEAPKAPPPATSK